MAGRSPVTPTGYALTGHFRQIRRDGEDADTVAAMWAFLSARLRMWLILAVVAPLVGWLLGKLGDAIEARRGPSTLTRVLQQGRAWLRRRSTGPLAPRPPADAAGPGDPGLPTR
jgi:hypothetical protein